MQYDIEYHSDALTISLVDSTSQKMVSLDRHIKDIGGDHEADSTQNKIYPSMPGKMTSIMVEQGQAVKKGDELLSLEAMKMIHMIKSERDGTIKQVFVSKGDQVTTKQVLLEFED